MTTSVVILRLLGGICTKIIVKCLIFSFLLSWSLISEIKTRFRHYTKNKKWKIIVIVLLTKNILVRLETFMGTSIGTSIGSKPLLHLVFLSIIAKTQGPLRLTEKHAVRLSHQLATSSLLSMQDHHWQASQFFGSPPKVKMPLKEFIRSCLFMCTLNRLISARLVQDSQSCGRFNVVTAKTRPISVEKCDQIIFCRNIKFIFEFSAENYPPTHVFFSSDYTERSTNRQILQESCTKQTEGKQSWAGWLGLGLATVT